MNENKTHSRRIDIKSLLFTGAVMAGISLTQTRLAVAVHDLLHLPPEYLPVLALGVLGLATWAEHHALSELGTSINSVANVVHNVVSNINVTVGTARAAALGGAIVSLYLINQQGVTNLMGISIPNYDMEMHAALVPYIFADTLFAVVNARRVFQNRQKIFENVWVI